MNMMTAEPRPQLEADPSPADILQIGMGFWASKTLLSAVELGVFTELARGPKTGAELERALKLHPRATADFLDALVALGMLARRGDGAEGRYMNTPATALYLDRNSPRYVGGILEMANARLYPFWADLTPALLTGQPQNEIKTFGQADVRRALRRSGAARAVHGRDVRRLARQFRGLRRQVRFRALPLPRRHRRRHRPARRDRRRAPPAPRLPPATICRW